MRKLGNKNKWCNNKVSLQFKVEVRYFIELMENEFID